MNMEMLHLMHHKLKLLTDLPPHHMLKSKTQLVANIDCEFIKSGRFQTLFENLFHYKSSSSSSSSHLHHQPFRWQSTSNPTLPFLVGLSSQPSPLFPVPAVKTLADTAKKDISSLLAQLECL